MLLTVPIHLVLLGSVLALAMLTEAQRERMERNRIQALQRLELRRLSEEALHRLHSIMHGDNDPAMLHVVHHLEDKDLLTALCVSRRWREFAGSSDDPHGIWDRVEDIRLECTVLRNAPKLVNQGLPSELCTRIRDFEAMGAPPPDSDYESDEDRELEFDGCAESEWLSCKRCDGLVRTTHGHQCTDQAWRCTCVPCYGCTEWFRDGELFSDRHCKDCWASLYDSPRPQTVESTLSDTALAPFRRVRCYLFDHVIHDRCTYCRGFVRVTGEKQLYIGQEKCECRPCRRCATWINDTVDDETTQPCFEERCHKIVGGESSEEEEDDEDVEEEEEDVEDEL